VFDVNDYNPTTITSAAFETNLKAAIDFVRGTVFKRNIPIYFVSRPYFKGTGTDAELDEYPGAAVAAAQAYHGVKACNSRRYGDVAYGWNETWEVGNASTPALWADATPYSVGNIVRQLSEYGYHNYYRCIRGHTSTLTTDDPGVRDADTNEHYHWERVTRFFNQAVTTGAIDGTHASILGGQVFGEILSDLCFGNVEAWTRAPTTPRTFRAARG